MNKETNISKVFIGFLIASTLIWLLINLSKEYTSTLKYEVVYEKLAQDKILQEDPVSEFDVSVKATGFNLLSANFSNRRIHLFVDKLFKSSSGNYYFLPNKQRINIQKQLPSGVKLEQIQLDTIHLKLGSLATKKVAIKSNISIQYQIGYNLAKDIELKPDSVLISGPELQLQDIKYLELEPLKLENVSKNIQKELKILVPEKVKSSSKKTTISIEVDKFTEGELEVPVLIKNISANIKYVS